MENNKENDRYLGSFIMILVALAVLSLLAPVAVAMLTTRGINKNNSTAAVGSVAQKIDISAITSDDHIRGDKDSRVKIVNYSDFYCPFCEQFHKTMKSFINEYDPEQVAWVYRHLPGGAGVPEKSFEAAKASECAFEQGGDERFWQFTDLFYEKVRSSDLSTRDLSLRIAEEMELDRGSFEVCLDSDKFDDRIDANTADAYENGVKGTPWSVVVAPDGTTYPISGSQPAQTLRQIVNLALEKK